MRRLFRGLSSILPGATGQGISGHLKPRQCMLHMEGVRIATERTHLLALPFDSDVVNKRSGVDVIVMSGVHQIDIFSTIVSKRTSTTDQYRSR
jgi:hypothetical protein